MIPFNCRGMSFYYVLFVCDALFELGYAVFPLTIVGLSNGIALAAGAIENDNEFWVFIFIVCFFFVFFV